MQHSEIVGGSSAARVIACPGSVALCAKMPPQPSSKAADEGTMLHKIMTLKVDDPGMNLQNILGVEYNGVAFTQEHIDEMILPAIAALDVIDPKREMEFMQDIEVHFHEEATLEGVFGSADLIGRIGNKALVIDYKFGRNAVAAKENAQCMFYAAAAMRTEKTQWAFAGATEVECVIIQPTLPDGYSRWVTTPERIKLFEKQLTHAVMQAKLPDPPLNEGPHCKYCKAKWPCPLKTGEVDRIVEAQVKAIDVNEIAKYLSAAERLNGWLESVDETALALAEKGVKIPGYKLVAKRGARRWVDPNEAVVKLIDAGLGQTSLYSSTLISPPAAEKLLKDIGQKLPENIVVSVSSGNTVVPEDDPRPEVLMIGDILKTALERLT